MTIIYIERMSREQKNSLNFNYQHLNHFLTSRSTIQYHELINISTKTQKVPKLTQNAWILAQNVLKTPKFHILLAGQQSISFEQLKFIT